METRLLKKKLTAANQYSFVRLTLNYSIYYDRLFEQAGAEDKLMSYVQCYNRLLTHFFDNEDIEKELCELRKKVTREVEILTAYTDCFQIYEYVLNRLERKFKTMRTLGQEDKRFADRLVKFITETKEAAAMNSRIKAIIGELPVRLTKQKFYSLVMEGLSVYIGSPVESLKDMMYILETESMTRLPEGMEEYKELYELLKQLERWNYRNMTEDGYEEALSKLDIATEELLKESSFYMDLQEMINDLYVLIITDSHVMVNISEEELCKSLILEILHKYEKMEEPVSEEYYDRFIQLEGRQESYYERYLRCDLPPEDALLNEDPDYKKAVNVDLLLSGSAFVELKKEGTAGASEPEKTAVVDRAFLEQTAGEYFKRLDQVFSNTSKPVARAVMAKTLSSLPVYFNSVDEIQAYIRGSLESCLDDAEKETCKELLEELMSDENDLV